MRIIELLEQYSCLWKINSKDYKTKHPEVLHLLPFNGLLMHVSNISFEYMKQKGTSFVTSLEERAKNFYKKKELAQTKFTSRKSSAMSQ